jgi:hypothetical protein
VSAPPESLGADEAVLTPGFERGALLLRGEDGHVVRVSWEESANGADRRRALPAGEYALVGYRLIREDGHGATWHVSAGGKTIRELELAAGSEQEIGIDPAIRMAPNVKHEDFGVAIQGESGAGLSIYKEGKRIPLGYRRLAADGKPLAEGKVNYG